MNAIKPTSRVPWMWPRVTLAMLPVVLAMLAVLAASMLALIAQQRQREQDTRLAGTTERIAASLHDRIDVADAWIADLVSASQNEATLRRRISDSRFVTGVVLESWNEVLHGGGSDAVGRSLPHPSAEERDALLTGRSVLMRAAIAHSPDAIYVAHPLKLAGRDVVGFFEVSGVWLWRGFDTGPGGAESLAVLDNQGATLFLSGTGTDWVRSMMLRSLPESPQQTPPVLVMQGWQQHGDAWRAALQSISWNATRVSSSSPWLIAAYSRAASTRSALALLLPGLLAALAVGALGTVLASLWATRRWQPALARVQAGLQALRAGAFQRADVSRASGVALELAQTYDLAIGELQQRLSAQACLAEIDRLLLEAGELEQVLEPMLLRVRTLIASQAAAVALLDRDSPSHARCFSVNAEGGESPVSRVNIDEELVLQLQQVPRELSVPAHHMDRYSFLAPLHEQGANCCCVWPIMAGERLAAVLAVGYRASEPPTQQQLSLATECAARLRFALTHADRGENLYRQAHFDSLTALPNRALFRDRLAEELRRVLDSGQRSALLYVDLDHFKRVNDSVGHVGGDQLLTIVAQRLRGCVKDGDTVARLGGDEFTVILRELPAADAAGEIARRIIEVVARPVNIAGRDHHVRASVGITIFPDDGDTLEAVMRNADLAMYQAKNAGRARAVFFDSKRARAQSPLAHSGIYRALRRREFVLHYQPQFQLQSGALAGVEALLRWPSSHQGMRLPRDFLPAAEESGLIVELGTWVLESACRQLASWREEHGTSIRLALNISVQQLCLDDFPQLVLQSLERTGLAPHLLELDFTEAALDEERPREALRALADAGVRLALDDFGAGYSSLNYLRQQAIHAVKIDASFMQEVPHDAQAAKLAATIIEMAHALGKQVIAEGVETLMQLDFLRESHCDFAQGYGLARPLPAAELAELLVGQRSARSLLQDAAAR